MFLKRGGRVSAVSAIFGTALAIKPVMHVDDAGTLKVVDKVRGRRKAIAALAERLPSSLRTRPLGEQLVYISHGDCYDDAKLLADSVTAHFESTGHPIPYPLITYVDPGDRRPLRPRHARDVLLRGARAALAPRRLDLLARGERGRIVCLVVRQGCARPRQAHPRP